jgi:hypothetical protein
MPVVPVVLTVLVMVIGVVPTWYMARGVCATPLRLFSMVCGHNAVLLLLLAYFICCLGLVGCVFAVRIIVRRVVK